MEKKNVVFTKDGAKVGVKEVSAEAYADKTQKAFVKTWNAAQDRCVVSFCECHAPPKTRLANVNTYGTAAARLPEPTRGRGLARGVACRYMVAMSYFVWGK